MASNQAAIFFKILSACFEVCNREETFSHLEQQLQNERKALKRKEMRSGRSLPFSSDATIEIEVSQNDQTTLKYLNKKSWPKSC
jgi:hypothetical protein